MEDPNQANINQIAGAAAVAAAAAAVNSTAGIMKELSEIKISQAKNDTEIKNIGVSVAEIKSDVKDIKALYVTHYELKVIKDTIEGTEKDHEGRLRWTENTIKYGLGFVSAVEVALTIYLALKK